MPLHDDTTTTFAREGEDDGTPTAAPTAGAARTATPALGTPAPATPLLETQDGVAYRRPSHADGAAMWELTRDTGVLDLNSPYAYLMMGEWFADAGVVAEENGRMVGFVIGFVPPRQPDTIFVWQVGVDASMRGRGLAKKMLDRFVRWAPEGVDHLEATVTPSNAPSEGLFRAYGRDNNAAVAVTEKFPAEAFPVEGHEAENLFRIGPIARPGQ